MRKLILPLLFLATSVNAMDLQNEFTEAHYAKSLPVVTANNLYQQSEEFLRESKALADLSYLSAQWEQAGKAVKLASDLLTLSQEKTLKMVPLPVICNNSFTGPSERIIINTDYEKSIYMLMNWADRMPEQIFTIMSLTKDKPEATIKINSLSSILSELRGTNLLHSNENAARAHDILHEVIVKLEKEQANLQNQRKNILFQIAANKRDQDTQKLALLNRINSMSSNLVVAAIFLKEDMN
ncbi:hypothetical protein [Candidatus Paracaedibacter symbiosus]|uniref:hypothetical protein n=1 Tax=Candidatus Paracaedibacter symbiosus TaxID=244582 RepID=UPI000509C706|nr:hypothetical protein [Candidatus Paracaedibacter symbiosus]